MNLVELVVLQWIRRRGLPYEKIANGFKIPQFNIKCIPNNQSTPVYKESGDRIVAEWALMDHISKLSKWIDGRPTLRIEKLTINTVRTNNKILIQGTRDSKLICEAEFWIESNFEFCDTECIFWYDTRYYDYHVPGWLSKCLKTILRLNLGLPIESITNAVDSAYHRIGFTTVEQVDVRYYVQRSNLTYIPYTNPENIIMWRLRYDSERTI